MKLIVMAAGLLTVLSASLEAQTGLTIYSGGRVLVRRTIPVAVPQGWHPPTYSGLARWSRGRCSRWTPM